MTRRSLGTRLRTDGGREVRKGKREREVANNAVNVLKSSVQPLHTSMSATVAISKVNGEPAQTTLKVPLPVVCRETTLWRSAVTKAIAANRIDRIDREALIA